MHSKAINAARGPERQSSVQEQSQQKTFAEVGPVQRTLLKPSHEQSVAEISPTQLQSAAESHETHDVRGLGLTVAGRGGADRSSNSA